jgi:hypothetical protein
MTDSAALLALAARCETEKPSRELDAEIAVACRAISNFDPSKLIAPPIWKAAGGHVEVGYESGGYWMPVAIRKAAAYTSSLVAAVTLVPPRSWYPADLSFDGEDYHFALSLGVAGTEFVYGVAATEPMARCAAALRARAGQ